MAWSAEGKFGWAADLTGDGYIQIPVGPALQGVRDFTLLGWFLQEQPSEGTRLWSLGRDAEHSISLLPNLPGADSFLFESRCASGGVDREGGTGEHAFPLGEWTHSALRLDMDRRRATLFQNGHSVLEVEDIQVDPAFLHEHGGMPACYLGRSHQDDGAFFRGRIDDVRLYRKALSDTTVSRVVSGDLVQAWGPTPVSGEQVDRETPITLTWEAGQGAVSHDLYVGTHPSALFYQGRQRRRRFALGLVEGGTTHYWRVDTRFANGAVRPGVVWDFTVSLHLVVDNMELYTDDPGSRIWDQWIDGIVTANGSTVGYNEPPYAELETVHSGRQAMPFIYDNSGEYGFYSQAFLDLGVAQDWTRHGMRALALHFWADYRNTVKESDILWVGIADTSGHQAFVPLENSMVELKQAEWHQWNVDLAHFTNVDLTAVQRIFLGVGDPGNTVAGGQGLLIVDDIQLWPPRCIGVPEPPDLNGDCRVDNYDLAILTSDWLVSGELHFPQDPGTDDLMSHWPLDGDAVDEVSGQRGIMLGGSRAMGVVGDALEFSDEEWIVLGDTTAPVSQAIAELDSFTAGIWARPVLIGGRWQRLFDFGNGTTDYLMLAAFDGSPTGGGTPRFHLRVDDAQQGPSSDVPLKQHEWQHVTARLNADTSVATIWINGVKTGEALMTHRPRDLGRTGLNYFGKSQWHGDGTYVGRLDEFRLYRRALTDLEMRYLAGLTEPYANLGEATASDLNTDGRVDALDLEILTDAWLQETLWPSP